MGALTGSLTYVRFKTVAGDDAKSQFTRAINSRRFIPLVPGDDVNESAGWVATENPFDDVSEIDREKYDFGGRLMLTFRHDAWSISRPRLKRETELRVAKICEEEGSQVTEMSRGFKKAIERAVLIEMRHRSTPRTRLVDCVWTPDTSELRVFGRGVLATETVASLFERTFGVRCELMTPPIRAVELVAGDEAQTRALSRIPRSVIFHG